jgi:acylphosphatase
MIARHLIIHGRVQGVCLGLTGWVRNRADGSVEAVIEGEESVVAQFMALAQGGPPAAKVARIETADMAVTPFSTFEKRPTA